MPLYRRQLLARSLGLAAAPLLGAGLAGCATTPGWTTLLDGPGLKDLNDWSPLGQGRWKIVDGALEGRSGTLGYLLTREAYADFELRCEFWADADCNSGLFLRCQDRAKVNADNAYEVNIFDKRPDPSYGTAAIVNVAKVAQPGPKAADRWNSFEVTARADRLVVVFNGQQTVDVRDARFRSGPIALQSAGGVIRFRRLQIRTL